MKIKKQGARIVRTMGIVFVVGILGIVAGFGGFESSRNAFALTYQNDTNILFTFNPAISLSISGDLSINNLQPNSASDSNIITVIAGSNTPTGYTLYTNVGDSTNNYTDLRLSSSDTTNTFSTLATGVSSLNGIGDSKWGYSYCDKTSNASACNTASNWVYGSTGGTSIGYGGMPLYNDASHNNDIVLVNTNNPDSTTLDFKIGAKASSTQMAGTYSNVINFINVPKVVTTNYTLSYLDRSGTTTSGTLPAATSGTTSDGTFSITTSRPTNTNADYVFKGWCTADNQSDVTTCPSGGAIIYPGNLYVIASTSATWTGNVYAVWNSNYEEKTIANSTTMQEVNSCPDTIPLETVYTLTDPRDNQTYKVARLKDGKCWMVENLNLAGGTALSADNTDVDATYINSFTTSNNLTKDGNMIRLPASAVKNSGDNNLADATQFGTDNYSYVFNSSNTTNCGASGQNTPCYSYYSWDAATLGSGRTIDAENTDAPYSICPKGWRLPTSGNTSNNEWKRGDFYKLATAYGANLESNAHEDSSTFYNNAGPGTTPNFLPAGNYGNGTFLNWDSSGNYWSSTSDSDSSSAHSLYFFSSLVVSASGGDRVNGFSVRCLFGN